MTSIGKPNDRCHMGIGWSPVGTMQDNVIATDSVNATISHDARFSFAQLRRQISNLLYTRVISYIPYINRLYIQTNYVDCERMLTELR